MQKTYSAGGVILNEDGQVVVVNQDGLTWSLPKGRLEPGEDNLKAAYREIEEETGLSRRQLKYVRKIGEYERHPMDINAQDIKDKLRHISFFLFTTEEKQLKPQDPANPEARWVDIDKVADLLTHKKDKEFFRQACHEFKSELKNL